MKFPRVYRRVTFPGTKPAKGRPQTAAGAGIFVKSPPNRRQIAEKKGPGRTRNSGQQIPVTSSPAQISNPGNPNDHPKSQHNQLPPVPWARCPLPPRPLSPAVRDTGNWPGENLYTQHFPERRFMAAQVVRDLKGLSNCVENGPTFQPYCLIPAPGLYPRSLFPTRTINPRDSSREYVPTTPDPTVAQMPVSGNQHPAGNLMGGHQGRKSCSLLRLWRQPGQPQTDFRGTWSTVSGHGSVTYQPPWTLVLLRAFRDCFRMTR